MSDLTCILLSIEDVHAQAAEQRNAYVNEACGGDAELFRKVRGLLAAHGRTEPKKLGQLMRRELDWIVMKALEKDRTRRYETANGFASDILRYLADEPVEACPRRRQVADAASVCTGAGGVGHDHV